MQSKVQYYAIQSELHIWFQCKGLPILIPICAMIWWIFDQFLIIIVTMKRRKAIKTGIWFAKSVVLAPAVFTAMTSCRDVVKSSDSFDFFSDHQGSFVRLLADTIIPRTATPSASDVKVDVIIDRLLADVFESDVSQSFVSGINDFQSQCVQDLGVSFDALSDEDRHEYVSGIDRAVMSMKYEEEIPFYYTFKQLVVKAYFLTEEGIKQNLEYVPIPGPFQAIVNIQDGGKIMVGNGM